MRKQITQNQFQTVLIIVFFVLGLSSQSVLGQEKPSPNKPNATTNEKQSTSLDENSASLEETLNWLAGKTSDVYLISAKKNSKGQHEVIFNATWYLVPKEKCTIDFTTKVSRHIIIPLSQLDPASVEVKNHYFESEDGKPTGYAVWLYSHNPQDISWKSADEAFMTNEVEVIFKNEAIAKRVSRAFQHAIKLCGGKVEPF